MRELLLLLLSLLVCLQTVHCQTLRHMGNTYQNNSFLDRGIISVANPLQCLTDYSSCCEGTTGGWEDPAGMAIQEGASGATMFYVTRTTSGEINLNRFPDQSSQQLSGMYQCEIPDSSGELEMVFIYLGNASTGELGGGGSCAYTSLDFLVHYRTIIKPLLTICFIQLQFLLLLHLHVFYLLMYV